MRNALTPPADYRIRSLIRRPLVVIPLALLVAGAAAGFALAPRYRSARSAAPTETAGARQHIGSKTGQGSSSPTGAATSSSSSSNSGPGRFIGPADGAILNKAAVRTLRLAVSGVTGDRVHGSLDGVAVTFQTAGSDATFQPTALADGRHTLELTIAGGPDGGRITRNFTVDTAPPKLTVAKPPPVDKGKPLTLSGTTESGSTLTANGLPVVVAGDAWKANFATAPAAVRIVAVDQAGNTSSTDVAVHFPMPVTRAIHMTALAWGFQPKRDAALALLRERKINAIEVDIKDESGLIGYQSAVPMAATIGAVESHYEVKTMVARVHAAGGRVIGRLVAFRDPKFTEWAWKNGHRDMVLQKTDGTPYTGSYGAFAFPNFANAIVQKYNSDLAVEAATLGFDDVLYDYVRRPDGKLADMRIPGLAGSPEKSIAAFVTATKRGLQQAGVTTYLGASVFGIAATRPTEIAQDVAQMAPYLDYVSPMVYPSHWAPGEYKVANPNAQPYDIVARSLRDFQRKVAGSNTAVIPWLQDFSLGGVKYGPDQVRAQLKAAADNGIQSFLLWNAEANYTAAALTPMK